MILRDDHRIVTDPGNDNLAPAVGVDLRPSSTIASVPAAWRTQRRD
ncbi:hypothetical protein [Nocardia sp. bgisy118]